MPFLLFTKYNLPWVAPTKPLLHIYTNYICLFLDFACQFLITWILVLYKIKYPIAPRRAAPNKKFWVSPSPWKILDLLLSYTESKNVIPPNIILSIK